MKRFRETMSCEKGFTLVELLVVIGIIGILAMMLLPQFRGMRDRARIASCQSNLKNIGTTLEAFYADKERYPFDAEWNSGGATPTGIAVDMGDLAVCPHDLVAYKYIGNPTLGTTPPSSTQFTGTTPTAGRIDSFIVYCLFHEGLTTGTEPEQTQLFVTERGVERH